MPHELWKRRHPCLPHAKSQLSEDGRPTEARQARMPALPGLVRQAQPGQFVLFVAG